MADNEVAKALDILEKHEFFGGQRAGRELWSKKPVDVQNEDIEDFVKDFAYLKDFIVRQNAEIEEHRRMFENIYKEIKSVKALYVEDIGKARAEAIKEFAERLKEKRGHDFPFTRTVFVEDIDDLVKEMTEEAK